MRFSIISIGVSALAASLCLGAISSAGAAETPPPVPEEINTFSRLHALDDVREMTSDGHLADGSQTGNLATGSATGLGDVVPVHEFSQSFRQGDSAAEPTVMNDTWITPVLNGQDPIGTALIWYDERGEVAIAEVTENAELAGALMEMETGLLVWDAPAAAWFALADGQLTTLFGPRAAPKYSLDEYASILAADWKQYEGATFDPSNPSGGGTSYLSAQGAESAGLPWWAQLGAVLAISATLGLFALRLARSRSATPSS